MKKINLTELIERVREINNIPIEQSLTSNYIWINYVIIIGVFNL